MKAYEAQVSKIKLSAIAAMYNQLKNGEKNQPVIPTVKSNVVKAL